MPWNDFLCYKGFVIYHSIVNALTSAEVTEQVPINTNISLPDTYWTNQLAG